MDAGRSPDVIYLLDSLGVDTIDLLLVSHNHADHIGGVPAVLSTFPVRFYLDNGVPASIYAYQEALDLVERLGITYLRPTARIITLGKATLRILPLSLEGDPTDQNNSSVGVLVQCDSFKALLTGDSEVAELSAWLEMESLPKVDVFKAGHHGSGNGMTPDWLEHIRPDVVVISVGAWNAYGQPDPWALAQYRRVGADVYRTDQDGEVDILVCSDGSYFVRTELESAESVESCRSDSPIQERSR